MKFQIYQSKLDAYANKYFEKTYQFFIDILPKKIHNIYKPVLSMGMSDNFDLAIECGSNLVRVGSAIFGKRNYTFSLHGLLRCLFLRQQVEHGRIHRRAGL